MGGLRQRFLLGALASAAISLVVFGGIVFALAASDPADEDHGDGDAPVAEAGELVIESMGFAAPIGAIAAIVTAALLARRTTRPLDVAIEAARQTSAHDLSRRLAVPSEPGELRELALAQNALFARLDDGFAALAGFAADASHELRTPLAVMAAELEVALRRPAGEVDWPTLAAGTLADTRRLAAVVDGLLALARAGADAPGTRQPAVLVDLIDGVVAQLAASAEVRGVVLAGPTDAVSAIVDANPATLDTAIRNLIANAIRHARARVEVGLVLAADGRTVAVLIDDDGPGLGEQPESLFAPLVRGPGHSTGTGLGLAIARRIAEAHDGTLVAEIAPAGGARLILRLPLVG